MLVKSVVSKVPTALAYDVARSSVGCQLRCQPRHLTVVLNYEALLAVLKLLTEARNRQPEIFIPTIPRDVINNTTTSLLIVIFGMDNFIIQSCVLMEMTRQQFFLCNPLSTALDS